MGLYKTRLNNGMNEEERALDLEWAAKVYGDRARREHNWGPWDYHHPSFSPDNRFREKVRAARSKVPDYRIRQAEKLYKLYKGEER